MQSYPWQKNQTAAAPSISRLKRSAVSVRSVSRKAEGRKPFDCDCIWLWKHDSPHLLAEWYVRRSSVYACLVDLLLETNMDLSWKWFGLKTICGRLDGCKASPWYLTFIGRLACFPTIYAGKKGRKTCVIGDVALGHDGESLRNAERQRSKPEIHPPQRASERWSQAGCPWNAHGHEVTAIMVQLGGMCLKDA